MSTRIATATRLGFREQARRPILLVLLVVLPFFFITRAIAATEAEPRVIGVPGGGECTVPDPTSALAELHRIVRPGGELRFYEHVHAHRQPTRAILEIADRTRVWPTLAGGCHPTRETGPAIEAAGFVIERCERFGFSPSPVTPKVPHILGVARRP